MDRHYLHQPEQYRQKFVSSPYNGSDFQESVSDHRLSRRKTPGSRLLFNEVNEAMDAPQKWCEHCEELEPFRSTPNTTIIEALEDLIRRLWFQRIWVVQEVFASESIEAMCGLTRASWRLQIKCLFGYDHYRLTKEGAPFVLQVSSLYRPGKSGWLDF